MAKYLCLITFWFILFFESKTSFNNDILQITEYYNKALNLSIKTLLVDDSPNHASPDGTIYLNRGYLDKLSEKYDAGKFKECLAFIIGHEFGHEVEFLKHNQKILTTQSCEVRTLLEAQADVLAGYLFYHINYNTLFSSNDEKGLERLRTVMTFVYDLGNYEYKQGTHPGYKQRRNAFRHGMIFCSIEKLKDDKQKKDMMETISNSEDLPLFPWSFDIAKKIIHYPSVALKDLALLEKQHLFEDPTGVKNTLVSFEQRIRNEGEKKISLFVQFKVIGADTSDIENPREIVRQAGVSNHKIVINPHQTITIKGKADWKNAVLGKIRPIIKFPPDNDLLYAAEYIDGTENLDSECPIVTEANLYGDLDDSGDLYRSILYLLRHSSSNFQTLQTGFVAQSDPNFKSFYCNYEVPGADYSEISFDKKRKQNSVTIFFCSSIKDIQYASYCFNSVVQTLKLFERNKMLVMLKKNDYQSDLAKTTDQRDGYTYEMLDENTIKRISNRTKKEEINVEGEFNMLNVLGEKFSKMYFRLSFESFTYVGTHFVTLSLDKEVK